MVQNKKTVQRGDQEGTSLVTPEAISLHVEDQAVKEKQSYAMLASIAYQRNLFPKSCFEMRSPSLIRTEARRSYKQAHARSNTTSSDNEMTLLATALAQRDQPLVVLAPGQTDGVDTLLAWLDEISKGLLERSLDGVQFSIYADKSRPSEILELYTFSFQYRDGKDGERRLMGLTAPGGGSGMITIRSVRSGMVNVIDQFKNYQQQLPALPSFMARTDAAQEPNHRPVLSQNMEYTRTVSRTLKPDLERRFTDQAAPPVGTWMEKRPRGIRQADEQGDSIRLEFSQGGTGDSDRSTRAIRQTISPGPPSKDSGESGKIHDTLRGDSLLPTQVMEARDSPTRLTWNWKLRAGKELEIRALWILYEKTPSSPAEFAQKLRFDGKTTQGLIKRLDEGGYLASGRTRLSPVTAPEQLMFRRQLYCDPLTSISGFYEPRANTVPANTETDDEDPRCKRIKTGRHEK
ncbi:hypothetical protein HO133_002233 [Letharia lupina]|uniref:HORMA domain-containing protein n=1 Tax=Letharia lupina TaxID=560253 RepID=A0A8H6CDI2_9LECA|nr:uncharacterized protein HO133_002233 [Letharia lupina]KAF6221378.1 hypothetical protein HO133_002233 [Letharia lupina]